MKSYLSMWLISLIFIGLFIARLPHWLHTKKMKRWYATLSLEKHLACYEKLFANVNGFVLSKQARCHDNAIEYTYGEIDFISFIALLSLVKPNANTVFYDLGSGVGKAVLACTMVFNIKKACGVERFSLLHHAALEARDLLEKEPDYQHQIPTIHFVNADFLQTTLQDATLIFINATAFFGEAWQIVQQCLIKVSPGTIVISSSKKLSADAFKLKKTTLIRMSWGVVRVFIQERRI